MQKNTCIGSIVVDFCYLLKDIVKDKHDYNNDNECCFDPNESDDRGDNDPADRDRMNHRKPAQPSQSPSVVKMTGAVSSCSIVSFCCSLET